MTDYCELADVYPLIAAVGELRDAPVAPATTPSATQLTATAAAGLITQVSAELNGHLRSHGYVVPVSDAEALTTLKAFCMSGTAARILRSLFPASEGVSGDAGAAAAHERNYQAGLDLIDAGGLAADMVASGSGRIAHGFRDSEGVALSYSELVTRTNRETRF